MGPPPPGANRGLGVLAMLLSNPIYASDAPLSTRLDNRSIPKARHDLLVSQDVVRGPFFRSMRPIAVVRGETGVGPETDGQRDAGAERKAEHRLAHGP